ncbi:MAG TPA: TIM44-like domain-containing protein [Burkholderiaceae bacterium]|jgi:predicted lipid-binding transport protein (Tim44 family)|nr:TIM44-like domain-containing protein [Burkholderiaceae bacterium]
MLKLVLSLAVALSGLGFAAVEAEAKRLGGGGMSGLQRKAPARQAPATPPSQQAPAAAPGTPGAAPAAAPGRSWMGPIAGLAAGFGLAALMSHLGLGEEMANILTIVLLAVAALWLVRFLARRFAPQQAGGAPQGMRYAGADLRRDATLPPTPAPMATGSAPATPVAPVAATGALPAGFDAEAFERIAKLIFIRMQAANDKADLDDLRKFATPEMFAVFKLDLQDRKDAPQQTDVVQLAAEVIDFEQEEAQQVVSVRFHGLIREELGAPAAPFDEIWHLTRPLDGSREWAIAGIAQAN